MPLVQSLVYKSGTSNTIWELPFATFSHVWTSSWLSRHQKYQNSILANLKKLGVRLVLDPCNTCIKVTFGIELMVWEILPSVGFLSNKVTLCVACNLSSTTLILMFLFSNSIFTKQKIHKFDCAILNFTLQIAIV